MINRSVDFDLGLDRTRIKDPRDGYRQAATVDVLLNRFFNRRDRERYELQVLADEVGMGKTFVALGVAFSILQAMKEEGVQNDLGRCYQRVLIVTPQNEALFSKWNQEVGEFVKRCVRPELRSEAKWFSSRAVSRIDELAAELRSTSSDRRVLVAHTGLFSGGKLRDYRLKRRFLLGVLFRYWGNSFNYRLREALLKGAPAEWPALPDHLTELTESDARLVPFSEDECIDSLSRLERQQIDLSDSKPESIAGLLMRAREIAAPYVRDRDQMFGDIERRLTSVYRAISTELILRDFPLVIVDEAHNWKNGPSCGANGYDEFAKVIARRARRLLLLTATPFQLRPDELLEILKIGDHLKPCGSEAESRIRCDRLKELREEVLRGVLRRSADASMRFSQAWSRLPSRVSREQLAKAWDGEELVSTRSALREMATRPGAISEADVEAHTLPILQSLDPDLRELLHQAVRLYVYNLDLSHELGKFVVRHRRGTGHRLFKIGCEYPLAVSPSDSRQDQSVLHGAHGLDVSGSAELPHYLLMRCVTEAKKAKGRRGRASLGSALTGCYSTLLESQEGKEVTKWLGQSDATKEYLEILRELVNREKDREHPKVEVVVRSVVENWLRGEKSLIFCFRVNTAERLREIIDERIRKHLQESARSRLGGRGLISLSRRLTGRDRDLAPIALDRVLWSLLWAENMHRSGIDGEDLVLTAQELRALARLALVYGVKILGDKIDRVFLTRAVEHLIARRLRRRACWSALGSAALTQIASDEWVERAYGQAPESDSDDGGEESHSFDERGVHYVYQRKREPSEMDVLQLADELVEARLHAVRSGRVSVLDVYGHGPNFILGVNPSAAWSADPESPRSALLRRIHKELWGLSVDDMGALDWVSRAKVMHAIRRMMLRQSMLLRLLPEDDPGEATLGEQLVESFFRPLAGQRESLADKLNCFLEDLNAASGSLSSTSEPLTMREALFSATRLSDQQFVALVSGSKNQEVRKRVFAGFNTPLLPEVLICTQVGQEGIDLHRQCRHVIHYDLAWNPAVLEQRTGRADRIGSKTFRERDLAAESEKPFLEIGVPFLAGTYDERMYEQLRLRSQVFEALTGGRIGSVRRRRRRCGERCRGTGYGQTTDSPARQHG